MSTPTFQTQRGNLSTCRRARHSEAVIRHRRKMTLGAGGQDLNSPRRASLCASDCG
jgi:hypothetical protein